MVSFSTNKAKNVAFLSVKNVDTLTITPPSGGWEAVFSTAYLPPVSYFMAMLRSEKILLESHENYVKQSYRNRCRIATANGVMSLNIPVESNGGEKIKITDVRISAHGEWQMQHWRAITSAYNSSPFFEYFEDDYRPFYEKKWKFLWDFNTELMQKTLHLLGVQPHIEPTKEYGIFVENNFKDKIHPKKESIFVCEKYYQVFEEKHGFLPDLSIVDLLFNMGNEAILYLNTCPLTP